MTELCPVHQTPLVAFCPRCRGAGCSPRKLQAARRNQQKAAAARRRQRRCSYCGAPHYARGLCRRCYGQARRALAHGEIPRDPRARLH